MSFLTREIGTVRTQKRLASECLPHGTLVAFFLAHLLLQYAGEKARYAGIPASRFDPRPAGEIFFQGNGDVSKARTHNTNIVPHGPRVKFTSVGSFNASISGEACKKKQKGPRNEHAAL